MMWITAGRRLTEATRPSVGTSVARNHRIRIDVALSIGHTIGGNSRRRWSGGNVLSRHMVRMIKMAERMVVWIAQRIQMVVIQVGMMVMVKRTSRLDHHIDFV